MPVLVAVTAIEAAVPTLGAPASLHVAMGLIDCLGDSTFCARGVGSATGGPSATSPALSGHLETIRESSFGAAVRGAPGWVASAPLAAVLAKQPSLAVEVLAALARLLSALLDEAALRVAGASSWGTGSFLVGGVGGGSGGGERSGSMVTQRSLERASSGRSRRSRSFGSLVSASGPHERLQPMGAAGLSPPALSGPGPPPASLVPVEGVQGGERLLFAALAFYRLSQLPESPAAFVMAARTAAGSASSPFQALTRLLDIAPAAVSAAAAA